MIFWRQFKCQKELILFCIYFHFPLEKKRVSSQAHFRSHDQFMIMIMTCSSTTPTWKIPSCDLITTSSNDILNEYSSLFKGLEYKSLDVVEGVINISNTLELNPSLSHLYHLINIPCFN
jgi:hypothetical protein